MNLLLDTQVVLWLFLRSTRLKKAVRSILADPTNIVYVSAVSTWAIAINTNFGQLELPGAPAQYLPDRIQRAGFTTLPIATLPIAPKHTYGVSSLPAHHRDLFDRLLIAQAQVESLTIVTNDRAFVKYDVKRIAA